MKIVFNGKFETKKHGCPVCGSKRVSKTGFIRSETYHVPSGRIIKFRYGVPVEVTESDAKFLLSYKEEGKDGVRNIFEVAND